MIEVYTWDEHCLYSGALEVDETGPMAPRSTPTKPMKLTGSQVARWTGSGWEKMDSAPEAPVADIEALRADLTTSNNAKYDAAISAMTRDYPVAEISTWERQRAEVVAWAADPAAPTPWIDIAATARGIDRGEYLSRTLAKVNAFALASAYLTGRRQGIDDQIRAATTAEELAAVVIDYTLPGA